MRSVFAVLVSSLVVLCMLYRPRIRRSQRAEQLGADATNKNLSTPVTVWCKP